jgi:HEAT repeat protein
MPQPGRSIHALALSAALAGLAACSTAEPAPEGRALTPDEIEYQKHLANTDTGVIEQDELGVFLVRLNQNVVLWHRASVEDVGSQDRMLVSNLEDVLQRSVYKNFDLVMQALRSDDPWQRTIAAGAIGFCRLDEPDDPLQRERFRARWPPLYPRALEPLTELLSSDDRALVRNALLSLWKIGAPDTPLAPVVECLVVDDAEIRSNAALALSSILTPETGDDAIDALINAMYDADPKVRLHAVNAAMRTQHPNAAGRLAQLLDDHYMLIQANAARALAEIGDRRNCRHLIDRLARLEAETAGTKRKTRSQMDARRDTVRVYLIGALETLSGEQFGDDVERWNEWWRDEGARS